MLTTMEEITVKQENHDALELEAEIINLCATNPKGVSDESIEKALSTVDIRQRVAATNRLVTMGKIEILKSSSGLSYRLKSASALSNVKGVDSHEKLVYQIIESAGNKGIWSKEIRFKCNLMLIEMNRILKTLQSKNLVKSVKSVAASKKKVYMLFNLKPDRSVTGGTWYSDQDFEAEFVEVLNQQCLKFLQQKADNAAEKLVNSPLAIHNNSFCSSAEVLDFISKLGISKVDLSAEDIETILNTLVYDGKVEMTVVPTTEGENLKRFRYVKPLMDTTNFTRMPCSICPVFHRCCPEGEISPQTCIYLNEWMEY